MPCHAALCEGVVPLTRRDHLLRYIALHVPTVVLREPFYILVLAVLALVGGLFTLRLAPYPPVIVATLGSGPLAWLWAAGLATGCVLGLAGMLRRLWWLESGALWLVTTALAVHAVASLQVAGSRAALSVAFVTALAMAGAIKAVAVAAANAVAHSRIIEDGKHAH